MVMIALRAYHRQIEEWIDQGLYDQAITHCRHILNFYPKSVDTYRLLGKAFLENHRYGDATDIFQRVLSSVPDDFVSHVGMSIVREDEGNINEAIWHMERAFEIQPSNNAIQGELRRLYGRRDGVEPPKINLNRGALARMYIKGNLHPQAIADLRVALAEDPQRPDLQVLLAKAYFETGQLNEAAEISTQLLMELPYCFEANRILREVFLQSNKEKEAHACFLKLVELDPYFAHISELTPSPELVVETTVMVEKLDQFAPSLGSSVPQQPEWASTLGINMNEENTPSTPDWINEDKDSLFPEQHPEQQEPSPESDMTSTPSEIPVWMRDAGWQESTSEESPESSMFPFPESENETIEPGELPDWLKELSDEKEQAESNIQTTTPVPEDSSWLVDKSPSEGDSIVTWLDQLDKSEETPETPQPFSEEVPDWLQDLNQKSHLEADFQISSESTSGEPSITESEPIPFPPEEELPPWLVSAREETAISHSDELPDWLKEDYKDSQQELPEWLLSDTSPEASQPIVPEPALSEEDTKPVFIHPKPEVESEKQEVARPADEGLMSKEDEAFAWLESLAAKQGADEALLLSPEERREQPPEWIREYLETQPGPPAFDEVAESVSEQESLIPETEYELPDWLKESLPAVEEKTEIESSKWLKETETAEEKISDEVIPEWLGETPVISEQTPETELPEWLKETQPEGERIEETELPSWLQSEEESIIGQQLDISQVVSAEEPKAEEVPEWLKEFQLPQIETPTENVLQPTEVESTFPEPEPIPEPEEISSILPGETITEKPIELQPEVQREESIEQPTVLSTSPFETARLMLQRGDLSQAFNEYQELIKQRTGLDQIISDLNDALYHFPMDVKIWMLLGDAYLRKDMLSEAMNAYNKAEELLR